MSDTPLERVTVYPDPDQSTGSTEQFRLDSGNTPFVTSFFTFFTLAFLLIGYPGLSLLGIGEDPLQMLKDLTPPVLMFLLLVTIAFQWGSFLLILWTTFTEKTGLAGLGFTRFKPVYFAWTIAFLLVSNLILSGIAWVLGQVGLPMPGEIGLLIPQDPLGRVVWVGVSVTAGVCEESMFRGYLMTRLRLLGKFGSWTIPTIVSAIAFGACHAYQGIPGFIVITCYGVLFALLYIRTGSIWPGILAHFLQDAGALFYPR